MADDIPKMDQGLLARHPAMSEQEFSDHWYYKHSQLVVPFFLHSGMTHYEQIHGPLEAITPQKPVQSSTTSETQDLMHHSGACALPPQSLLDSLTFPKWKQAYYDEVIKADERRFLVSEALEHLVRVPPQSVRGTRRVVIEEGRVNVHVEEGVWEVWREYEARGKRDEMEEKRKAEGLRKDGK